MDKKKLLHVFSKGALKAQAERLEVALLDIELDIRLLTSAKLNTNDESMAEQLDERIRGLMEGRYLIGKKLELVKNEKVKDSLYSGVEV